MKLLLANPRGFCAGVDRAIEIVETALDLIGPPIYVRHEVVHNRFVVESLRERGAIFVDSLDDIPDGQTVIFSAHGVAQDVKDEADARELQIFDATCPLVTKVHMEVLRHCKNGDSVVLIGHKGHPEVEGTMGQYRCLHMEGEILLIETPEDVANLNIKNPYKIGYVTQTTLSIDDTAEVIAALRKRFPEITGQKKDDICYATQNRQDAVKELATECDLILVVGSPNSSNSNRLRELAEKQGRTSYLIDGADDIDPEWLHGIDVIGVTAGASAPEVVVSNVIKRLQSLGAETAEENMGTREDIVFVLPKNLRLMAEQQASKETG
ncbi:MAG: 4-hydroxy-3-methylbut-2-enyl diphosphate reductase [Gammaproteobacteria bacterium]|nr:4-hydroxy-3-methylbut-2-enyl diphosphate reductase [Gammaproteobacteria bacterium]